MTLAMQIIMAFLENTTTTVTTLGDDVDGSVTMQPLPEEKAKIDCMENAHGTILFQLGLK